MRRACGLLLGVAIAAFVSNGRADADGFGSRTDYALLGFTADAKYVAFTRETSGNFSERWFAIYDAATQKLKTSQPVLRYCGPFCADRKEISEAVGNKTIAKLHAKYGTPDANTRIAPSNGDRDVARIAVVGAGYEQTFTRGDLAIVARTKLRQKRIPNAGLMVDDDVVVTADVELKVTVKGATHALKKTVFVSAVQDENHRNVRVWPELYVQQLGVSPDGKVIAFVFARRPYLMKLPAPAKP